MINEKTIENLNEIDKKDLGVLSTCAEYANNIFNYLRKREEYIKIKNGFSEKESDITPKLRENVIEWMIKVQIHHSLKNETLYLAVKIFERFLEKGRITHNNIFFLGVVAILISAK